MLEKRYSSYRSCSPEETLAKVKAVAPQLGISRVCDVTALDFLGLPVYSSIRPLGKVLCVNAGKGVIPVDAEVGAYMEALEYAVADFSFSAPQTTKKSVGEIAESFASRFPFRDFGPKIGIKFSGQTEISCIEVSDLVEEKSNYLVPSELVFVPPRGVNQGSIFGGSSNGLASGNTKDEATLHALFELAERDVTSMARFQNKKQVVRTNSLPPPFQEFARDWKDLRVELIVHQLENQFELPCFEAYLIDHSNSGVAISAGAGLHFERSIALSRAICEAAQSRLSHIHGGRDDITNYYKRYESLSFLQRQKIDADTIYSISNSGRKVNFETITNIAAIKSIENGVTEMIRRLVPNPCSAIFRYEFETKCKDLFVVKIVAPGLEHIEHNTKRFRTRAMTAILNE